MTKRPAHREQEEFVTFDQEWAELCEAAARRSAMRLNSVPAEGGSGGSGDLVVNRDELGAIGNDAYGLRTRLSKEGDLLVRRPMKQGSRSRTGISPVVRRCSR